MFKREAADEVEPKEDSIEEVNIKSGVAENLFQGDILLTKEQKEKIALDVEKTRAKRQAFNDKGTWPARKWTNGVTFILAGYFDERTNTVFKKAAKLWMEDTCINITEFQWSPKVKGVRPPKDFLMVLLGGDEGCQSYVGRKEDLVRRNYISARACQTVLCKRGSQQETRVEFQPCPCDNVYPS
ncbi:hypothetical protein OSTOST_13862 [Ostertagia ostertagi]